MKWQSVEVVAQRKEPKVQRVPKEVKEQKVLKAKAVNDNKPT